MSKINFTYTNLTPFKWYVLENFPFIEADFDALTNWQLLCKLGKEMNKIINSVNLSGQQVEELTKAFNELQDYVNQYFSDLNVQNEINNKLDEMTEDGTLAKIINDEVFKEINDKIDNNKDETDQDIANLGNKINNLENELKNNVISNLDWKNILNYDVSKEDLYNNVNHCYLQGMCYVKGNLLLAFINDNSEDNLTRYIEVNPITGQKIRETYLPTYHANSLSYREDNNTIYVSYTSQYQEGIWAQNNGIGVIDYNSMSLIKTINLTNLPTSSRIRSCYYDNTQKKLYGFDSFDVFEIDENTSTITNTIILNNDFVPTDVINQSFKVNNNKFVGIFTEYIGFWKLDGTFVRLSTIPPFIQNQHIGEIEDLTFDENNNFIIGTTHNISSYLNYRTVSIFKTNSIYNSVSTIPLYAQHDTTIQKIYVDTEATNIQEDGSSTKPFKNLQKAINFARYFGKGTTINLKGTNVPFTMISGCNNLIIEVPETVNLEHLFIQYSKVTFDIEGKITIGGIFCNASQLILVGNSSNYSVLNYSTLDTPSQAKDRCGYFINSTVMLRNFEINGSSIRDNLNFSSNCFASVIQCNFTNYNTQRAIFANTGSVVNLNNLQFSIESTETQHIVAVNDGAVIFKGNQLNSANDIYLFNDGYCYPSIVSSTISGDGYSGVVCKVNPAYDFVRVKIRVPATNSHFVTIDIPTNISPAQIYSAYTDWINNVNHITGIITFQLDSDDNLNIYENRILRHVYEENSFNYYNYPSQAPQDNFYPQVVGVEFLNY